ncbi:MAG TPA: tRNA cytidylyltransferase [Anaeromyxobacteraceae bacterium]|nr:tRNA cytidylyltransferase [Anaeromyxobacteraceae bacterium]
MRVPAALARATFPGPVLSVLRRLADAGHRSWLVGGAVRDLLLHRPREAQDFDVATPATPPQVISLFPRVIPTGIDHGTVTVLMGKAMVEVTTFRGEGEYVDGRRPESVVFHGDLTEDLARRDFTINALAFDPLQHELRDPFDGRADLRRRLLRAVGDPRERFAEDGLRAMRAVRFAAQLGYDLHPRTRAAIPGALDVVRKVSTERIAEELSRLIVAPHAERGLELMRRTGLFGVVLPAVGRLPPAAQRHCVSGMDALPPEAEPRFAWLLHRALGPAEAARALFELRLARRVADGAGALLRLHACALDDAPLGEPGGGPGLRRWLAEGGRERAGALVALRAVEARACPSRHRRAAQRAVRSFAWAIARELERRPPLSIGELALDGRGLMDLAGADSGAWIGETLRHLLDRVLVDPSCNTPERLGVLARAYWAGRGPPVR